jgi:VanZ family protein
MAASPSEKEDLIQNPAQPETRGGFWSIFGAWLPVLFCMAVIATESTEMFGADHTTGPLRQLCEYLFGAISDDNWETIHFLIRKTGHFTGYGILSLAWFRAFRLSLRVPGYPFRNWIKPHALAMLGTLFVASSDEIHQTFLPNRTGTFHDVLVDCSGALIMQVIALNWIRLRSNRPSH